MEHIPEPSGVETTWVNTLQCVIAMTLLAMWVIHQIRPDIVSETAMWLIVIPFALCFFYSLWLMRKQAHIR